MQANRELAAWLVSHRQEIEAVMNARLGAAAPRASGPEAETLRRFRSFAATALMRGGEPPSPSLEGLRPSERRVMALLMSWADAAERVAGPQAGDLRRALAPLLDRFRLSLRSTASGRRAHGAPRASRRAVTAAIDRVCDAFLAVDVDGATIADANPAAGAALGVSRDALLGLDLLSFVPEPERRRWWNELDAIAEGGDSQRFPAVLQDVAGLALHFDASVTRFATRERTLALVLLRPLLDGSRTRQAPPASAGAACPDWPL